MHVCMYVCMDVSMYVCMCVCVFVCVFVYMCVCMYVCVCIFVCACMCVCIYIYVSVCVSVCVFRLLFIQLYRMRSKSTFYFLSKVHYIIKRSVLLLLLLAINCPYSSIAQYHVLHCPTLMSEY